MIRTAHRDERPDRPGGRKPQRSSRPGKASTPNDVAPSPVDVVHHESARKKRGREPAQARVNLTSMIDVIFQLLIYFVVTSTFALDEGIITTKLPAGTSGKQQTDIKPPHRTLYVEVSSMGLGDTGYRINVPSLMAKPNSFTELAELLTRVQFDPSRGLDGAFEPDNPVVIRPKGYVRWQHVVNAFNSAVQARYTNVGFAEAQSNG